MLRDEDIRCDLGRASHRGDFLRLVHTPTGVSRYHPGPLRGVDQQTLIRTWLGEIEAELIAKGLRHHVDPHRLNCE